MGQDEGDEVADVPSEEVYHQHEGEYDALDTEVEK